MQQINIIILIIIYINILFSLITLTRYLISKIAAAVRYSNITQYKITNWYYTISCVSFYILCPMIGLYCLRFSNLSKELDLKNFYRILQQHILSLSFEISYIVIILSIILIIFIILNALLTLILIYKLLNNQNYNLYFFVRYNSVERNFNEVLTDEIRMINDIDIISYYIQKFSKYLTKRLIYYKLNLTWDKRPILFSEEYNRKENLSSKYYDNRPWYYFNRIVFRILSNKYYKKFIIPFSPFIIILYDCIFNDWVITHVYYYLLIYVPVMLIRKITILLYKDNELISGLIWDILYKKETCLYALPKDHRKLFDIYVANGIQTIDLGPPAVMDFDECWFIHMSAKFTYNEQENIYYNAVDRSLETTPDKRLVYKYTDYDTEQEVEEEWYPIALKYAYKEDTGKYEIIVHVN